MLEREDSASRPIAADPEASMEERKKCWLWSYGLACFEQVIETCRFLETPNSSIPEKIRAALHGSLAVTYAQPFGPCHGAGRLPDSVVPSQFSNQHQLLMDLRHKAYAHRDGMNFSAHEAFFGNINQVRVEFTGRKWALKLALPAAEPFDLTRTRKLAEELAGKARSEIGRFMDGYRGNRSGEFRISISEGDSTFIPLS
jgi:hypothetical protein